MKLIEDLGMLYPLTTSKRKARFGLYECIKCGNHFKAQIQEIKRGNVKSCGCLKNNHTSHRLYNTWNNMIHRCSNPKVNCYDKYGGAGITVCERWKNFNNFIEDMYPAYEDGLSLDRKDNDLGYSKDNCRWVNKNIQSQNTRLLRNTNTSGYRGVSFHKNKNKWISSIKVFGKQIHLGYFSTALDAAKAYNDYVIKNNLEHTLNII